MGYWLLLSLVIPEFFGLLVSWLHCPANQKSATALHHPGWGLLEAARCWLGGSVGEGILGRSIMVASPNISSPLFQPLLCSCQKVWVEVTLLPPESKPVHVIPPSVHEDFPGKDASVRTGLRESTVSISSQLCCQVGSLQSTVLGAFIPQQLAKATDQSSTNPCP